MASFPLFLGHKLEKGPREVQGQIEFYLPDAVDILFDGWCTKIDHCKSHVKVLPEQTDHIEDLKSARVHWKDIRPPTMAFQGIWPQMQFKASASEIEDLANAVDRQFDDICTYVKRVQQKREHWK